ncbi:MAG: hypothetical protein BWY76_00258 [bacterium ADurb.Bin429]|nr:MAG: hypothetical protein BWY76_00258 [bacterium ADurb.Bin429]
MLANTAELTALEFADETGARHLVALNRKGGAVNLPGVLSTDAYVAYARKEGEKVTAAALLNGKALTAWGTDAAKLAPKAEAVTAP